MVSIIQGLNGCVSAPWLKQGIFDLRQRQLRHTFLAHDAPVKSIVVDENEEFFISGSEDGDIKVRTN